MNTGEYRQPEEEASLICAMTFVMIGLFPVLDVIIVSSTYCE